MYLILESAGWWLLHSSLGGGFILLVTRGLMSFARQPALKQRLAECGLLAALAVAALCCLPAWLIVPWSWAEETVAAGRIDNAELVVQLVQREDPREFPALIPFPNPDVPQPHPWVQKPEPGQMERIEIVPLKKLPVPEKLSPVGMATSNPGFSSWWSGFSFTGVLIVLAAIYGVILLWFLVRLGLAIVALSALRRNSASAPEHIYAVLRDLVLRRRLPRLLMSYRKRTPLSFGLFRPTILLPAAMCATPDRRSLRWVLRHELTHLQRGDAWSSLLCVLARAAYFYLPWSWSICRQVRLCQEFLADASAIEEQEAPEYAEFLLTFSKPAAMSQVATGISGSSSDLFRRVTMLLEKPVSVQPRTGRPWLLFAGVSLMTLAVLVSGLGLQAQAQDKKIIIITDAAGKPKNIQMAPLPHIQVQVVAPEKQEQKEKVIILKQVQPQEIEVQVDVLKLVPDHIKVKSLPGKPGVFVEGVPGVPSVAGVKKTKVAPQQGQFEFEIVQPGKDNVFIYKKVQTSGESLEKVLQKLKEARTQEELKAAQKELAEAVEKLMKQMPKQGQFVPAVPAVPAVPGVPGKPAVQPKIIIEKYKKGDPLFVPAQPFLFEVSDSMKPRLGVGLETPSKILAEQLDLPRGEGLVVTEVFPSTPAEKAGLKENDILLKFGGKAVPSDPKEFTKMTNAAKAGTPIDIVILRKGQEKIIKGVQLQEQQQPARTPAFGYNLYKAGQFHGFAPDKNAVMTTMYRTKDRFNCRHQEGTLILTVAGSLEQNKAKVEEIQIQDGGQVSNYTNINKVPAQYRDKVNHIVDMVNKGIVQVQTQDQ